MLRRVRNCRFIIIIIIIIIIITLKHVATRPRITNPSLTEPSDAQQTANDAPAVIGRLEICIARTDVVTCGGRQPYSSPRPRTAGADCGRRPMGQFATQRVDQVIRQFKITRLLTAPCCPMLASCRYIARYNTHQPPLDTVRLHRNIFLSRPI